MKYLLEKDLFNLMLKFVIISNLNPDANRCNIIFVIVNKKEYQLTVCCNENKNQIVICEVVDEFNNEIVDERIIKCCFDELVNAATNITINKNDLRIYKFYKKIIEPAIKCCELNQ
jgi:hypothetical protein